MAHVSYSEIKNWHKCPYYHKLTYIDRIRLFKGNEFTAFGTALHNICENMLLEKEIPSFDVEFLNQLKELPEDLELRKDLVEQMRSQAPQIIPEVLPALKKYFGEYEVISAEEVLMEKIEDFEATEYDFKGYIDLVLKTADGKYHIIDWKTCSWGWHSKKKADKMILYQLVFYKYYFCSKHDISPENVEVYFGLLKRTAKKNNVELFKVTSGQKRTQNAINFLTRALYNINNKNYVKNKAACRDCEFYKTKFCK